MKAKLFLVVFALLLTTASAQAMGVICRSHENPGITVEMHYGAGNEHHVKVIEARTIVGRQSEIHCGTVNAGWRQGREIFGVRCSSHLPVGGDSRYRRGSDFALDLEYVTSAPHGRGTTRKATGDLRAAYRDLFTNLTMMLDWKKAYCLVTE